MRRTTSSIRLMQITITAICCLLIVTALLMYWPTFFIFISLILEVVLRIAVHHIPINQQAAVLQVVITINRQQEAIHHRTIAVQRNVLLEQVAQRKVIHMTHMMMAMMISSWMANYDYFRYNRNLYARGRQARRNA